MSATSLTQYSHTFELPEVIKATVQLISDNADHLIRHIYNNTETYADPVIRVGLVIKILLRGGEDVSTPVDTSVLDLVMRDLNELISQASNQIIRQIYTDELKFVRGCAISDDLISLNTTS